MDQPDKQKRKKLENFLLALAEMLDLDVGRPLRATAPEASVTAPHAQLNVQPTEDNSGTSTKPRISCECPGAGSTKKLQPELYPAFASVASALRPECHQATCRAGRSHTERRSSAN
jgi:hypothetical protein